MAGPWHAGMSACWHVPIQWTHKPVSVSVFSIQPSRLSLSTDTDCTALVCSRGENLALLSRIRGNFVTFVQFVGNNQPLPLCLAPWLGAACRHGPGHSALWETGKCKKRILINSEPLRSREDIHCGQTKCFCSSRKIRPATRHHVSVPGKIQSRECNLAGWLRSFTERIN